MKINLIEYEGKHYIFYNTRNEKKQMFIDRTWFIVKNIHKEMTYEYLENLSYVWINHKYLGVLYPDELMTKIESCGNIYTKV